MKISFVNKTKFIFQKKMIDIVYKIMIYGYHLEKKNKKFYNVTTIQVLHRLHNNNAFNAQGNNLKVKDLLKKYY